MRKCLPCPRRKSLMSLSFAHVSVGFPNMLCSQIIATFSGRLCKEEEVPAWWWWVGVQLEVMKKGVTGVHFLRIFPHLIAIVLAPVSQNGRDLDCLHVAWLSTWRSSGSAGDHWRFTLGNTLFPAPCAAVLILSNTWGALVSDRTNGHKFQLGMWPRRLSWTMLVSHESQCCFYLIVSMYI